MRRLGGVAYWKALIKRRERPSVNREGDLVSRPADDTSAPLDVAPSPGFLDPVASRYVAASADFQQPIVARGSPAPNRHVVHARATLVTHPRDGAAAGLYMLCHVCGRLRPPQQGARHQGDPGLTWRRSPARQSTPRWRRIGSRTSGGIDLSENRPWQSVKIDASFVRELASRDDAVAIVRAVAGLARSLGITSTAEGVEGTACDSPRGRLR
jgi:EAL domain